jgi:hypothetical protein
MQDGSVGSAISQGNISVAEEGAPAMVRPDQLLYTRLGRLVLLLAEAPTQPYRKPADIERIGAYDFFADNPLLLFPEERDERKVLLLAGFDPDTFSYHSSSQRFANRRARMQHDLAHMLALGLVEPTVDASRVVYRLTGAGDALAVEFSSSYADGYRVSARLVVRELNRLSDRRLRDRITEVLEARPFVIDLYREPELDLGRELGAE